MDTEVSWGRWKGSGDGQQWLYNTVNVNSAPEGVALNG